METIINNINAITNGNREITGEQFEDLQVLENIFLEYQGGSATNIGCPLYGIFEIDDNGNPIGEEINEIVILKN